MGGGQSSQRKSAASASPGERDSPASGGQVQASRSGGGKSEVLFFPDDKMPCRYGSECRRGDSCDYAHNETNLTRFLKHLKSAEKTMDVCVFNITCNEIADALLDAHKRGVTVRIITDDDQSKSRGSDVESLSKEGIQVGHTTTHEIASEKFE